MSALLDRSAVSLLPVARTTVSVHYETGHPSVPVLSVVTPSAVRLPNSIVTSELPGEGPLVVDGRTLQCGETVWKVTRWWRPARPRDLEPPANLSTFVWPVLGVPPPRPSYDGLLPAALVGAGPGLTPAGDDVLAGALVTAHATADSRLANWRDQTRAALQSRSTTVVSRGLLHHAMDGFATDELAGYLTAHCNGKGNRAAARERLLAVGHSSGAALLAGALHTLNTRGRGGTEGAAP